MNIALQLNPQDPPELDSDHRPSYYTRNREQVRESQRLYRESNRDKIRAIHKAYYLKNRANITAYKRQRWHERKAEAVADDAHSSRGSTYMYEHRARSPRAKHCQAFDCSPAAPTKMQLDFLLNP